MFTADRTDGLGITSFFLCGHDYKNVAPDHKPIDLKVMMGASEIYWTRRE